MNETRSIRPESPAFEERLRVLKEAIPECFTEGKLDPDRLRELLVDTSLEEGPERYGLFWPGKREARSRAFKPSKMALHNASKEGVNDRKSKNLIIEGENLEVLKLLSKSYRGRVKLIYIDPPYNADEDRVYDDTFSESEIEFEKSSGLRSEDGSALVTNRKSSGRYHSKWLSMMYPRLLVAKDLLASDGVIFISIDDNEVSNLKSILDEVFGAENFEGIIHWRRRYNQPNDKKKLIALVAEFLVCYTRSKEKYKESGVGKLGLTGRFSNPDNDPRGDWASKPWKVGSDQGGSKYTITSPSGKKLEGEWMGDADTYAALLADNRIYFPKDGDGSPRKKYFKSEREEEGQCANNWWPHDRFGHNEEANDEVEALLGKRNIFSNPKPTKLLKNIVQLANASDDAIILDFFAGSGTTAQAVLELNEEDGGNRQFVLVQMPEATPEDSAAREAGYETIAEITKERVRRVIKKIETEKGKLSDRDRGFRVYKLAKTGFKEWRDYEGGSLEEYEKQLSLHLAETDDKAREEDLVAEIMLREGFPLDSTVERLEEGSLAVTRVESASSAHRLFVCLDEGFGRSLTVRTFEKLGIAQEDVFICLDSALSDEAKLRIRELCRLATI